MNIDLPAAGAMPCTAVDVVVARGTQEPGLLGTVIGDPLFGVLPTVLRVSASGYRVNYPADLLDPGSVGSGTAEMTEHVIRQSAVCPNQRFILVGYSQGAVVVHGVLGTGLVLGLPGIQTLPGDLEWRVAAVLLFGDPVRASGWNVPDQYAWRTADYCAAGDPICGAGSDPAAHMNYGWAFWPASEFASGQI